MKILSISSGYYPAFEVGGIAYSVHGLNRALVSLGHEVTNYATHIFLDKKLIPNEEHIFHGVHCRYFAYSKFFEKLSTHGWQLSIPFYRELIKTVHQYDIVHIHATWNFPSAIAANICRKENIPYIYSPHGMLSPVTIGKKRWIKEIYFKCVTRNEIKYANAIQFTSVFESENAKSRIPACKDKVIIPNGTVMDDYLEPKDADYFQLKYPYLKGKKVILFLGRISWIKGIDLLIEAFANIKENNHNIHLVIAGNDECGYEEKLKKLIESRNLCYTDGKDANCAKADISFTGIITGRDKIQLLKNSDIFVLPSRHENFANTVLEAAACDIPLILSDQIGVAREFAEKHAALIVRTDKDDIINALSKLLNDDQLCRDMVQKSKELVTNNFTWRNIAVKMVTTYEKYSITEKLTDKQKILCVSSGYYPAYEVGGIATSVHGLNKALVKIGNKVTVVASNKFLENKIDPYINHKFDGVNIHYFPIVRELEMLSDHGWQVSWGIFNFLLKNIRKFDIVHIHATWNFPSAVAAYLCKSFKKNYIFTPHGVLLPVALKKNKLIKYIYKKLFTNFEIKNASIIHFSTIDEMEKSHFNFTQTKKRIIPFGIDEHEFTQTIGKSVLEGLYPQVMGKKIILYLGRLNWIKGLEILIKSYYKVKLNKVKTHLIIAGNDEENYEFKLKNITESLQMSFCCGASEKETDITFTGTVKGREKICLYKASDIFVLPSFSENFGITVLEAAICGLPMILSNKVGAARYFKGMAEIIEPEITDLIQALLKLLDNETYCSKLSEEARKRVLERFTWESIAMQMSKLYESSNSRTK